MRKCSWPLRSLPSASLVLTGQNADGFILGAFNCTGRAGFVSLLVVFFGVVAIIQDQAIFEPIIDGVLELDPGMQPGVLFVTNGARDVLSPSVKMEVGS